MLNKTKRTQESTEAIQYQEKEQEVIKLIKHLTTSLSVAWMDVSAIFSCKLFFTLLLEISLLLSKMCEIEICIQLYNGRE